MTQKELDKLILESPNVDWFNNVEVNINYPAIHFQQYIKGFSSIYQFMLQQINGWEKINSTLPADLANSKSHFENLRNQMVQFSTNYHHTINNLLGQWPQIKRRIEDISTVFTYDAPETEFLIRTHENYPNAFSGALSFITGSFNLNGGKDNFIGILLAYEFILKDDSHIAERKNAERSSIKKIRSDFYNYLKESQTELVEHLDEVNKTTKDFSINIDLLKEEKEKLFQDWFEESGQEFKSLIDNSEKSISDLETTYTQLLALKAPADYWKQRAIKLNKEGWKALYWLIGLVAFSCVTLYLLLWLTPEGMLLSFIKGQASAIKWSIIYITFISFLAFGIRALNKVAFSSFHLSRDAEEREQLTYVYLAMIKDASVDEKDRHLIM
ncbi:DUF6161 domain-containing protein [Pelobium sp.]|nr:DUF6161 domain-containing protein [Pelobium sp.]MDA9554842.1 DUF6161 domain-containing protein [Pelobium sp.]